MDNVLNNELHSVLTPRDFGRYFHRLVKVGDFDVPPNQESSISDITISPSALRDKIECKWDDSSDIFSYPRENGLALPGKYRVWSWPEKYHLTLYGNNTRITPILDAYMRFRLCSNANAASLMHHILNVEMPLLPLDASHRRYIDFHSTAFYFWAKIVVSSYGTKYKEVTITHDYDQMVHTAFKKESKLNLWNVIDTKNLPRTQPTETTRYRLWVGCQNPKAEEQQAERASNLGRREDPLTEYHWEHLVDTLWLENIDDLSVYRVIDQDYVPREYRLHGRDSAAKAFMAREGTWKKLKVLNFRSNKFEQVVLWARVSEQNVIQERVVAKRFQRQRAPEMTSREEIDEHIRSTEISIENEIELHSKLTSNTKGHIIRLLGVARRGTKEQSIAKSYVIYTEYAARGSLDSQILFHQNHDRDMPEIYMWLLILNLARACQEIESLGWCHPDIKPLNIFIKDCPESGDYAGYPVPVLGDFGMMCEIDILEAKGTEGWLSPEHLNVWAHPAESTSGRKVHVWSIGAVVLCSMRQKLHGINQMPIRGDGNSDDVVFMGDEDYRKNLRGGKGPESLYSHRLEHLVSHCLDTNPAHRPTLTDLQQYAQAALASWEKKIPGLKNMLEQQLPDWERVGSSVDRDYFSVGSNFEEAKSKHRRGMFHNEEN